MTPAGCTAVGHGRDRTKGLLWSCWELPNGSWTLQDRQGMRTAESESLEFGMQFCQWKLGQVTYRMTICPGLLVGHSPSLSCCLGVTGTSTSFIFNSVLFCEIHYKVTPYFAFPGFNVFMVQYGEQNLPSLWWYCAVQATWIMPGQPRHGCAQGALLNQWPWSLCSNFPFSRTG